MSDLAHQRCFHHPRREAVARCPECGRFYCRECVTEHEGRVLCAACLAVGAEAHGAVGKSWLAAPAGFLVCLVGGLLLWGFFYGLGRVVLSIPAPFHQGTFWTQQSWLGEK